MDSYCVAYLIDGYFGTLKSINFLNDIIARFSLTLSIKKRLMYAPKIKYKQHDYVYKLKDFQNLKSITKKFVPRLNGQMTQDDNKFWELKLWIEYKIRDNGGEGNYVDYELLLEHSLEFYKWKDNSTAKAKCRNIWNWYENRGWAYHMLAKSSKTKEEIKMTRQERARKNATARAEKAKKTVINAITGLYADEYKKKNGKWHYGKIAKDMKLDRDTVAKYVKLFDE